jgi:hypothetical protein
VGHVSHFWLYDFFLEIISINWIFFNPFWIGEDPIPPNILASLRLVDGFINACINGSSIG